MNSFAAKMVFGEGRFYSKDEDSLSFCKQQLLFSAFQEVITKELDEMGLDSKLFWKQFDNKYDEYFMTTEESLKKKYRIDETEEETTGKTQLSEAQIKKNKEKFAELLRNKRLINKTHFKNIDGVVSQYKVKKMTRSTQYPNSRYLSLYAKVDREKLNGIYYDLTHVGQIKKFKTLFLTTNISIDGSSWTDVGVEVLNEFQEAIEEHWNKWLLGNLNNYVEKIVVTDESSRRKLSEFFKLSKGIKNISVVKKDTNEVLGGPFEDGMWLTVNVTIRKKSSNTLQGTRGFSFYGDYILLDLNDSSLIDYYDFSRPVQNFNYENDIKLRSAVATAIYSIPLDHFNLLKNKLSKLAVKKNSVELKVSHISNLTEIFKLEKILERRGITLQLQSQLIKYNGADALLRLNFVGEADSIKNVLLSLRLTENSDFYIQIPDVQNPFEISVVRGEQGNDDA